MAHCTTDVAKRWAGSCPLLLSARDWKILLGYSLLSALLKDKQFKKVFHIKLLFECHTAQGIHIMQVSKKRVQEKSFITNEQGNCLQSKPGFLRLFSFIHFPTVVQGLVRQRQWFFFGSSVFLGKVQSRKWGNRFVVFPCLMNPGLSSFCVVLFHPFLVCRLRWGVAAPVTDLSYPPSPVLQSQKREWEEKGQRSEEEPRVGQPDVMWGYISKSDQWRLE